MNPAFLSPEKLLVCLLINWRFLSNNRPFDELIKQTVEFLLPKPGKILLPSTLKALIDPDYIGGPFFHKSVRQMPRWKENITFLRNFFIRELKRAKRKGIIIGDETQKIQQFHEFLQALFKFENKPGQRLYDNMVYVENIKVVQRFSNLLIYDQLEKPTLETETTARTANLIVEKAFESSLLQQKIKAIEQAKLDPFKLLETVRSAYKSALWASAPQIWFSDPEVQKNKEKFIQRTRQLMIDAENKRFSIDSIEEFVTQVLLIQKSLHITYFVDDNGDLVYHLYLIQAFLMLKPNLKITISSKKGRQNIDANLEDVTYEINKPQFCRLKSLLNTRVYLTKDGPEFDGIHLRYISEELAQHVLNSDYIIALGQSAFETLNGIKKPGFYFSVVDSQVNQQVTGLRRGDLYFFFNPDGRKNFDQYEKQQFFNGRAYAGITLMDTVRQLKKEGYLSPRRMNILYKGCESK